MEASLVKEYEYRAAEIKIYRIKQDGLYVAYVERYDISDNTGKFPTIPDAYEAAKVIVEADFDEDE